MKPEFPFQSAPAILPSRPPRPRQPVAALRRPGLLASAALHVLAGVLLVQQLHRPAPTPVHPPMTVELFRLAAPTPEPKTQPSPEKKQMPPQQTAARPTPPAPSPLVASMEAAPPRPEAAQTNPAASPTEASDTDWQPPSFDADYLSNPAPDYPAISRKLREKGEVLLTVWVNEQGEAQSVELHRTSGFRRLDNAAIEAVRRWKFHPARQGGRIVAGPVIVPIAFTLDA